MDKAVKSRLETPKSIEVSKGANGGFKVTHRFDNMGEGAFQPPQEHNFGPEKGGKDVIKHLKGVLGLGQKAAASKNPAQKKAAAVVPPAVMD
jgi:hypothetical protein